MKRFALFGAGFWGRAQLAAWGEVDDCRCVAVFDPDPARAEALAATVGARPTTDPDDALDGVDFVDVVAPVEVHAEHVLRAAARGVDAICQKPLGRSLAEATAMVEACRAAGTTLLVHENFRWQPPFRALLAALESGVVGRVWRAEMRCVTAMDILANQPFLADLDEYLLTDLGSHHLDMARRAFGEPERLYAQIHRVNPRIRGEDAATIMMLANGATVVVHLAEAETPLERDVFPETTVFVEGTDGSISLAGDYTLRVTTRAGTTVTRHAPPDYPWTLPGYGLAMAAMPPLLRDLSDHLHGRGTAETTGEDNLKTVRLVFAAYESARDGRAVTLEKTRNHVAAG